MAHLVRPWIVRYLDKAGKRVKKGTRGARKHRERSPLYYAQGVPGYPPKKRVPLGVTNKAAAQKKLADLVTAAEKGQAGMADPYAPHRWRPLAEHVEEYIGAVRTGSASPRKPDGASEEHAAKKRSRILAAAAGCGWKRADDIDPEKLAAWLHAQRGLPRGRGGFGAQTANHHLHALKAFTKWLVRRKRLAADPLLELQPANVRTDRRHDHYPLTPDELRAVLAVAAESPRTIKRLTGPQRFLVYATAAGTGFRAEEISSLTPASFDFADDPPTATVAASTSKNRRTAVQPLPPDLAAALHEYSRGLAADDPLWPGLWYRRAAEMLSEDEKAAGISYEVLTPEGVKYRDFHGLRAAYVTMLGRAGATVRAAQVLARHSTPELTFGTYAHADRKELAAAVRALPALVGGGGTAAAELARLDRPTLEAIAAAGLVAWALLGAITTPAAAKTPVAPGVAPTPDPPGDSGGRRGTKPRRGRPAA